MPPSAARRSLAGKSSPEILAGLAAGGTDEELRGHQGFTKKSRVKATDASSIPVGIMGLLPRISCAKAQ